MPPTLIGLAFIDGLRPKHIPYAEYYDLTTLNHTLKDWKISVQGSQVVFISPIGGVPGGPKAKDESVLIQIPRVRVQLYWSGAEGDVGQLERGQWPAAPAKAEGKGKP
jgi:hypothetical protein